MADGRDPTAAARPSIRDVARLAGVSHQTVSRVLNDHASIRPETRRRVEEAMVELRYRPSRAARALVTRRSMTLGVLAAAGTEYGPTASIAGIESAARAAGYAVSTVHVDGADAAELPSALAHLLAQSVEGLVVIAPQRSVLRLLAEQPIDVPYVTLHSVVDDGPHSLSVDQIAGARLATRHLIDLGHRRIAHLAGPSEWLEADARVRGYLDELDAAGIPPLPPIPGDWTSDFGYRAARELLVEGSATAVFCANDQTALGALHAAHETGVPVPERLSVVGFDDVPESAHFWPPLTTIRQDFAELGRRSVAALLAASSGGAMAAHPAIEPQLVVRASSGPPNGDG